MQGQKHPHTESPVLVTGATGYISGVLIKDLLQLGYKVRGTVRSVKDPKKLQYLMKLKNAQNHLKFVEADLNKEDGWNEAVKGCEYVFHVASPFPSENPKHENDVIEPAVKGTTFVTEAAVKNKVRRIVVTSSCQTIMFASGHKKAADEEDWSDITHAPAYMKSKVLAEKKYWELYHQQDLTGPHTEFVSVLPSLVLGPGLVNHGGTTEKIIEEILKGGFPGYPASTSIDFVDVRDISQGEIKAMFTKDAAGQRIALSGPHVEFGQLFKILENHYPKAHVNNKELSIEELKKSDNKVVKGIQELYGLTVKVDNSKSKKLLGLQYRPFEKTVTDMADHLFKQEGSKL